MQESPTVQTPESPASWAGDAQLERRRRFDPIWPMIALPWHWDFYKFQ